MTTKTLFQCIVLSEKVNFAIILGILIIPFRLVEESVGILCLNLFRFYLDEIYSILTRFIAIKDSSLASKNCFWVQIFIKAVRSW